MTVNKCVCVMAALGVMASTTWFMAAVLSPEAHTMAGEMQVLQGRADEGLESPAIKLTNRFAAWRWVGSVLPCPVLPHSAACTQPSTACRFLPFVGEALLAVRYAEYHLCMETLIFRAKVSSVSMQYVACMAGILTLTLAWLLWRRVGGRWQDWCRSLPHAGKQGHTRPPDDEEDDEQYLRRRVPFLAEVALLDLGPGRHLASGGFSSVKKVTYQGQEAVIKELIDRGGVLPLLREGRLMVEVEGAGGVPEVLAVCPDPPAMVQVFVGDTYDKYLHQCSVGGFLDSLVAIARRLGEIHAKGVVHNDVRPRNITFTGSVCQPVFHLIDLGLACRPGQIAGECLLGRDTLWELRTNNNHAEMDDHGFGTSDKADGDDMCLAPEVMFGRPVFAASDVYSLGILVQDVASLCHLAFLTGPLRDVAKMCTARTPRRRCSLSRVAKAVTEIKNRLPPRHLSATLGCRLYATTTSDSC